MIASRYEEMLAARAVTRTCGNTPVGCARVSETEIIVDFAHRRVDRSGCLRQ
jgi:hypothetical protein